MATRQIVDLFDCRTLHIIGGSQEYFFLSLKGIDLHGNFTKHLDLTEVNEIEWLFAPYSVIPEKQHALLRKKMSTGEIVILEDGSDGEPNRIQIVIKGHETNNLQGAFRHQIVVSDGLDEFVPFEGIININKRIQI